MTLETRREAIAELGRVRDSSVIVLFLSDRRVGEGVAIPGMNTVLAGENNRIVHALLRAMGHSRRLDLVLYANSFVNWESVWPLVDMCRSFADEFSVLIPMRAGGAGTMVCLGPDQLVLGEAAELSSLDSPVTGPFNPVVQNRTWPINMADVLSYFHFVKSQLDTESSSDAVIVEALKIFSSQVHPLALGQAARSQELLRSLARKLLALHLEGEGQRDRVTRIVDFFTLDALGPPHVISAKEAVAILGADWVSVASPEVEEALWALYREYAEFFELDRTFNVKDWMWDVQEKELLAMGAAAESKDRSYLFRSRLIVRLMPVPPQTQTTPTGQRIESMPGQVLPPTLPTTVNVEPISSGWFPNSVD